MRPSTFRLVLWLATALAAALGAWQLVLYYTQAQQRRGVLQFEQVRSGLRPVAESKGIVRPTVAYYDVLKSLNITGVPPKKAEAAQSGPADSKPAVEINPVDLVLSLRATIVHASDPKMSKAVVFWKDAQISDSDKRKNVTLKEGDWFPKPYDKKYCMKKIEVDRALVLSDDGTERPILVPENKTANTMKGSGGQTSSMPAGAAQGLRPLGYVAPEETKKVGETGYQVSPKDLDALKTTGLDMIGREVHLATYIDPKTRRPAGLRVTSIRPGSLAEKLGGREGDIVKEVNGSSIRSTSDIYNYAQEHPGAREISVTVERYGRAVNLTYILP